MSIRKWELSEWMRCPVCGSVGETQIVIEDSDWWNATCDVCGHSEGVDPTDYIVQMLPAWFPEGNE